jgi:hypothetical protein
LWFGLALWWLAQCLTGPAFMVQNGATVLRPQLIGYTVMLVSIPAKWWVGATGGHEWIPWVGAALYVLVLWPACWVGYNRSLRLVEQRHPAGDDATTEHARPRGETGQ